MNKNVEDLVDDFVGAQTDSWATLRVLKYEFEYITLQISDLKKSLCDEEKRSREVLNSLSLQLHKVMYDK